MRILMTNLFLRDRTGSETATAEIARALRRAGHDIWIYSPNCGRTAEELAQGGPVTARLDDWKDTRFDVAHVHHNVTFPEIKRVFPELPCVYLCHGWLPPEETPPVDSQIHRYLAVSEETAEKTQRPGVRVMRNAVDTRLFFSKREIGLKVRKVLAVSNHFKGYAEPLLAEACKRIGAEYELAGMETIVCWDMHEKMQEADLVVSLGRGAIEAMACGRAVLVFDHNGGDGLVDKETYSEIRKFNFSGRRYGRRYTVDELIDVLSGYRQEMGRFCRQAAFLWHDVDDQARRLVEEYICAARI